MCKPRFKSMIAYINHNHPLPSRVPMTPVAPDNIEQVSRRASQRLNTNIMTPANALVTFTKFDDVERCNIYISIGDPHTILLRCVVMQLRENPIRRGLGLSFHLLAHAARLADSCRTSHARHLLPAYCSRCSLVARGRTAGGSRHSGIAGCRG
jgi:hypothetical protein